MAPYMLSPGEDTPQLQSPGTPDYSSSSAPGADAEPIAICGLACRLPGEVYSASDLWRLLVNGRSAQGLAPASRFNIDGFYHPKGADRPGSMNAVGGYFLQDDIRNFENDFFGINNMEATFMDPQQRKLLEVVFECFESAGVTLENASGSNTGCYVGNFTVDFQVMQNRDPEYFHRYSATGMGTTILGNRVSHVFNLTGPSLVIDTACSSSLYCLHMACVALEKGECDAAIVAGANLIQSAEQHIGTMKAGVLSATGTCHTFDASADGYGRADGIGALYLKRLSDAIRDGDPIRSVIRGTSINANGKTSGITLPSAAGQAAVIRKAYAKAQLDPRETSYVECHGTGTAVGDPIETDAVSRAIGSTHSENDPLLVGSVKTNLGHSEAASGITSVIKVALALENSYIPPTIGIKKLNPKLKLKEWKVDVVSQGRPWPGHQTVRRAGVNSFGYGGANSHAILESVSDVQYRQGDLPAGVAKALSSRTTYILPFSAATDESLAFRVEDLAAYPFSNSTVADLAYTLTKHRSTLNKRGFVIAESTSFVESMQADSLLRLAGSATGPMPVAFVCTGQGAQWAGMGKELLGEFPEFSKVIDEMDSILQDIPYAPEWTLRGLLQESTETSRINEVTHSQPICTALQVGLIHLLQSWGIGAAATTGHSSGEIAAAYAAGNLTLKQAIVAAYYRGYVVGKNTRDGAMAAAGLSRETADERIAALGLVGKIRVACVNSPESVTISGDAESIDIIVKALQDDKLFARKLKTGGRAYHSHHMLDIGDEYEALLMPFFGKSLQTSFQTDAKFVSSVTGEIKTNAFGPAYWRSNLENPVEFAAAITRLSQEGAYQLVELGPHSALEMPIKQIRSKIGVAESALPYMTAIVRGKNAITTTLTLAGKLHLNGQAVDLLKVNGLVMPSKLGSKHPFKVLHDLPPYRWHYEDAPLWNESRISTEFRQRKYPRHELLGSRRPGDTDNVRTWRNILRLEDVDWLPDHKLEDVVVFPGAGYVSMAIEAMSQIAGVKLGQDQYAVRLENVNIQKALSIQTTTGWQVEINTVLRPKHLSDVTISESWWEFEISSINNGITTMHASGSVGIDIGEPQPIALKFSAQDGSLEPVVPRTWYDKLIQAGLNFGPQFQSITGFDVPRMKSSKHCTSHVPLLQLSNGDGAPTYAVHPITIDAMLQTAIVATASGNTAELRAKVPTKIGNMTLNVPAVKSDEKWQINAQASVIGFGAASIKAELYNQDGTVTVQMENVRLAPYEAAAQVATKDKRHPMLRVLWKPDIHGLNLMRDADFTSFITNFANESKSKIRDEGLLKLGAALNLTSHKKPSSHILEIGNDNMDLTVATLKLLYSDHAFRRLRSYTTASVDEAGEFQGKLIDLDSSEAGKAAKVERTFDLVLLPVSLTADTYLSERADTVAALVSDNGLLLAITETSADVKKQLPGFEVIESQLQSSSKRIILAKKIKADSIVKVTAEKPVLVVERATSSLGDALVSKLASYYQDNVKRMLLSEVTHESIPSGCTVISLIEAAGTFLSTSTDTELKQMKALTDRVTSLVWVTNGGMLDGKSPEFALAAGLSRALILEQPSLSFYTYDIDSTTEDVSRSAELLSAVLQQSSGALDYEFIQRRGIAHISRFISDDKVNDAFRIRQGLENKAMPLKEAVPCQIGISNPGQFDTVNFRQYELPETVGAGDVQVRMKALGLNAKDFYSLGGKVDTPDATCSLEFCGIVERVGAEVTDFKAGDRVVVMAPGHFKTSEIVPQWAVKKLLDTESFTVMSTMGVVYATALYALRDRAQLKAGESVLIHSAAGGVGIAAIQIAQIMGAEVFGTVSSDAKRKYLIETFGIKPENLFTSRDSSFLQGVMDATNGRGVDVVLNSLTGDLLHASWKSCAPFGRFIEIGKYDLTNAGKLDMQQFLKNVTFSAFDLSNMYSSTSSAHHQQWSKLMQDMLDLYREKKIMAIEPLEVFDVTDVTKALRQFGSRNRMGKIAISLEDDESYVNVRPHKYAATFSSTKTYLMVGCLGGLGRSMSKWMLNRGARNFVFLGRSGLDKAPARRLVNELQNLGATVHVVRGDVCKKSDVEALVQAAQTPIGGVIQAAMGLNENLFSTMPNEHWHTGIDPKVFGSWNLHHALAGKDAELDFFLMTSSVSGTVGTATESNYCAANYFLDNFARYRRGLGLPATSIGFGMISEVGYLHENPEIEKLLLRKGILPINEDELLQVCDIALSTKMNISHAYDQGAAAHILTGLEPLGVLELRRRGFQVSNLALDDPRASILAASLDDEMDRANGASHGALPAEVTQSLQEGLELGEAVGKHIAKRFSDLILLPLNKVDMEKVLSGYGMDSMIGAEFRTWFFKAFKVDIPFLELLSDTVTLKSLSETVTKEIEARS